MPCKLVAKRFTADRSYIGDVINAYPMDMYLGLGVEPVGGAFVIIEINDADKDDPTIQALIADWFIINPIWMMGDASAEQYIEHPSHDKRQYLEPVEAGDPFFTELLTTGRINVPLDALKAYIRTRS